MIELNGGSQFCHSPRAGFLKTTEKSYFGKVPKSFGQILQGHSVTRKHEPTSRNVWRAVTGPNDVSHSPDRVMVG